MKHLYFILTILLVCTWNTLPAKVPTLKLITLQLIPDHTDFLYKTGEKVNFKVAALRCGCL